MRGGPPPINQLLVPFFFLFVGISVNLGSFGDVLIIAVLVTCLAVATKFLGCGLGTRKLGRRSGHHHRGRMVPRGEVGIIVASIGAEHGSHIQPACSPWWCLCPWPQTMVPPPLLTSGDPT